MHTNRQQKSGIIAHVVWMLAVGISLAFAAPALAADKLVYTPPEAWVKPLPVPPGGVASAQAPVQVLLADTQVNFADDSDTYYSELAIKIQAPAGLQGIQPMIGWNPDTDTAIVHKVVIIRGDKIIDLLAEGQTFTIMRREGNLELSMLDGRLTAAIQPEGLQVGDIIDYAFSIKRHDPVLQGHSEAFLYNPFPVTISRLSFRGVWSKKKVIRWRMTDDLTGAKLNSVADGSELRLDVSDAAPPKPPEMAPARYYNFRQIEFSQFASWGEVSSLMAPLYKKAATLSDTSALKAEVQKIAAASPDPKIRAAAALHLVQNQVRYVFLGINQGSYVPADADVTWTRRFGDCKGKTALLLALLHQLGIEAEPALISTNQGDGLNERLPLIEVFDHVMVRATIGGKVYWLDGTRYGDRDIDSLTVPDYYWALPVRSGGASLEALTVAPLTKPAEETFIHLDASGGLDAPAPAHLETIYRGDKAVELNLSLAAITADEQDKQMRSLWRASYDWIEIQSVSQHYDESAGELHLVMEGTAKMEWDNTSFGQRYLPDGYSLGWNHPLKRDPGPRESAPVYVSYPGYSATHEEIVLPYAGKGFTITGDTVDKALAGYAFKRSMSIEGTLFKLSASTQAVAREIPYAEAVAAVEPLKTLSKGEVYLNAPPNYKQTDKEVQAYMGDTPVTAEDFLIRGDRLMRNGQYDQAIADFGQAITLDPRSSRAVAARAMARAEKKDTEAAAADIAAALKLNPNEALAFDAQGRLRMAADDNIGAIESFSHALDRDPEDGYALQWREILYERTRNYPLAEVDAKAILRARKDNVDLIDRLANVYLNEGKTIEAEDLVRKALMTAPDNAPLHAELGEILARCINKAGDVCEADRKLAVAEYDKSLAINPTPYAYVGRAHARPYKDHIAAMADIEAALQLDPDNEYALFFHAALNMNAKAYDQALVDINKLIAKTPANTSLYNMRVNVYTEQGRFDLAAADADILIGLSTDKAQSLNNACFARAESGKDLDKALEQCNAALKLKPDVWGYLDSRGLVYLQMGKLDLAIADYEAALKLNPDAPLELFPLGVAKIRKGMMADGMANVERARELNSHVDKTYARYGITAPAGKTEK